MPRVLTVLLITLLLNAAVFGGAALFFRDDKSHSAEEKPSNARIISRKSWRLNFACFLAADCLCSCIAAALTKGVIILVILIPLLWLLCGWLMEKYVIPRINEKVKMDHYKKQ